ncbi:VOC family protein [Cellulomonas dongxiuzhuiae]|uniref:Glyoxalase n=1 Tax=Cellulomonas dongxiuzhuiae TaxID=2819979 RepID=A0ABX8GH24_9CELL|nr:VOC family protein [Cellulomonas dongxiuzhuiae]MBO3086800.1 glyoxalase [Cellulomonas dongxiuzhuiae]MBO3093847.1 glyoxalase [Cellulomonas dongxiuzhuiae]QWC14941.1 glyoxalase [Cellulomonas dongxiuzhuiae]
MDRILFVTLPVHDVATSRSFYTGLGLPVNEMFSDEQIVCVVVSDTICVMLMDRDRFADFTPLPVADARTGTQVLLCLTTSSHAEVDALVTAALARGGSEFRPPQDDGSMYARAVADPDGHVWELLHVDHAAGA